MSLTLEMTAFETPDGEIGVALGVENRLGREVRIGSSMSQLYEITPYSDSVRRYGGSFGHMAAPHHLTLPSGKSKVFIRTYRNTHPAEEFDHMDADEIQFTVLDSNVEETVMVDGEVLIRTADLDNLTQQIEIIPSELSEQSVEEVISSIVSLPETDNELQMG